MAPLFVAVNISGGFVCFVVVERTLWLEQKTGSGLFGSELRSEPLRWISKRRSVTLPLCNKRNVSF